MKPTLLVACCIALCSVPVLSQNKVAQGRKMSERGFLDFAAQTDMIQANIGQLAETTASAQPVRGYAETLVADQTKDFQQLCNVAHEAKLNLPTAIYAEYNTTLISPLNQLRGSAFDRRYIRDVISNDARAIAVYKREAADARNPFVKSYAEQALPSLHKHLEDARALEKAKTSA